MISYLKPYNPLLTNYHYTINYMKPKNLMRILGIIALKYHNKKSGKAEHIWKEKGSLLPLWDEVQIIDRVEHWRIRRLKESAHVGLQ